MKLKKKINIIVEKTDTGFSAYAEDYPIYTTGINVPELLNNALEATQLYFDDDHLSHDDLNLEIDFKQFFKYYRFLNANFLAKKIGINPTLLSQYINGHKRPSKKQTQKILDGIHEIGQELTEINLISKE
ncbi:MAG: helix-turn-helix transcriptional regulator [Bacteroidales bacterium]|nr:helix-turn-helix transcriptional regulator [Bacteroidales bacterium]MCF8334334.1 helix-turn-helix transcriptional regulator [Bacteroidales bacterium]